MHGKPPAISYDADESGAVGKDELAAMLTKLGEAPNPEKLDALIAEVDEDGDAEIDFQVRPPFRPPPPPPPPSPSNP